MHNIEVYKQAEGFTTEFKVRKDLGLMDRGDCVDGLDLHDHKVFDNQVHPIAEVELYSAIDDRKTNLSRRVESAANSSYCRQAVYVLSNSPGPSSV